MSKDVEMVMCFETDHLVCRLSAHDERGFFPVHHEILPVILEGKSVWFAARWTVEQRGDFRQVIPYVVIAHGRDVVTYRRARTGEEERLHDLLSIGAGGHVNLVDAHASTGYNINVQRAMVTAVNRELREELGFVRSPKNVQREDWLGIILDDSDEVSQCHFGVILLIRLLRRVELSPAKELEDCRYTPIGELLNQTEEMENWSRLCVGAVRDAL